VSIRRAESPEAIPSKHTRRTRFAGQMLRSIGAVSTVRVLHARLMGDQSELDLEWNSRTKLTQPLHVTSRPCDLWTVREVLYEGSYDLPPALRQRIDGRPIVDLGANIGISAAYFASQYPHSSVLGVEPHPRNFQHLAVNASRYANIHALQAAVAPDHSPITMTVCGDSEEIYIANRFSAEKGITPTAYVDVVTPQDIDQLLGNPDLIGLLKVDIEGAERDLFASAAADILLRKTTVLAIETHERFVPGCEDSVASAAARNGLTHIGRNDLTDIYSRM